MSDETTEDAGPRELAKHWRTELKASEEAIRQWHVDGKEALDRFLDEGRQGDSLKERRWNLFYAGTDTQQALLMGQVPRISVDRRHADAADDSARVGGTILQRLLNTDLDENSPYYLTLLNALQDFLIPGLGVGRVRFEAEPEEAEEPQAAAPAMEAPPEPPPPLLGPSPDLIPPGAMVSGVPPGAVLPESVAPLPGMPAPPPAPSVPMEAPAAPAFALGSERAEVEFIHWQDFRWSAGARTWAEVTWVAFKALMSRKQMVRKFGSVGKRVPLTARQNDGEGTGKAKATPWDRAEVWEVWDKETRRVYWLSEGHPEILGQEEDPLGLRGFFPCPRPMASNLTTRKYVPRPDYALARDLYGQIDTLQTRLSLLEKALRVVGARDKEFPELERIVQEAQENELIPVDKWAMLGERGGLKGVLDWFPLEQVASTITALTQRQDRLKAQLDEVTGLPDILRGQGKGPGVTATQDRLSTHFASARFRRKEKEFARFSSDLASLRAEVIANKFPAAAILAQANMAHAPDMRGLLNAVEVLKGPSFRFRVKVLPEALAMADEAQVQGERMGVLETITKLVTTAMPLAQSTPSIGKLLLGLLQWAVASVRGSAEIEGLLDETIAEMSAAPPPGQQPPPPDPKLELAEFNATAKERQIQLEAEARRQEILTQEAADNRREVVQREQNVLETLQELLLQRLIEQGWTPPGGLGALPTAAAPVVPPPPVPPVVPPMGGVP